MRKAWLLFLLVTSPVPLSAQSLLERTPNLSGGWVGTPGTVHFNFLHRFTTSGAPERQITNYPSFLVGYAPLPNSLLGVNYATRSDIAPRFPNEYEIFARFAPASVIRLQAGFNHAAESIDGEVTLTLSIGPVRVLGAARVLGDGYASDTTRFALAGGAVWRIGRWLALAGDAATLLDARDSEEVAWSAALQIGIPHTPHTLSVQAANTHTATLQGQSRGSSRVRYGFEFTVPITLARYFGRTPASADADGVRADALSVDLRALQFVPASLRVRAGQAVAWRNHDQVAHTVTAADGSWTSPLIQPGAAWQRVFQEAGTYEIVCTPHPFMRSVVQVVP